MLLFHSNQLKDKNQYYLNQFHFPDQSYFSYMQASRAVRMEMSCTWTTTCKRRFLMVGHIHQKVEVLLDWFISFRVNGCVIHNSRLLR